MKHITIYASTILMGLASRILAQENVVDLTDLFAGRPEIERLHYYKEVNLEPAVEAYGISGRGVRITIMGEMVDADHPEINAAVKHQFNAFAVPGQLLPGEGNQPFRQQLLKHGDGHGTHIAGTIAAACDGDGVLGIACGATLDVYSIGAYDNDEAYIVKATEQIDHPFKFLEAFASAMEDVTARGFSKIVTGSFNIEAPALRFVEPVSLSIEELLELGEDAVSISQVLNDPPFDLVKVADRDMLARVISENDDDLSIAAMALTSQIDIFQQAAEAVGNYQKSGGVYIVTESNYQFEDRTSVLNAMPTLSDQVDPDLWLSVVMVQPEGIDEAETEEEMEDLREGRYIAPLNGCGTMAKDYCIVVPSYDVLSTMTPRVAEEAIPLFQLDGAHYQLFSGHSMGAPMVAGALALMQEYNERENLGLTMKDLVRVLKQSANRNFKGFDPVRHGVGMLDIGNAIKAMEP
jgi:subtilisin family serine protease